MSQPPVGSIVLYILTPHDVGQINRQRSSPLTSMKGDAALAGRSHPMLICGISGNTVRGQVFLDGNDTIWVWSITEGHQQGCWYWPPRA